MINLNHVPVVKVLIPFALGSLAGYKALLNSSPPLTFLLAIGLWILSLLMYRLREGNLHRLYACFPLFIQMLFFFVGMGMGCIDRPLDPGIPLGGSVVLRGKVKEEPVLRYGKLVFGLELRMAYADDSVYQVRSLVKAYLDTGSCHLIPEAGDIWDFSGRLIPIRNAGNPGEVDYASILRKKNCWYRFYCDPAAGFNRKVEEFSGSFPGPARIRKTLSAKWEGSDECISLLKAVCLGDRSGLSEDLRQSYSMAGGMHVLAVSGLHVGLIWWVLNRLFLFIGLRGKRTIYRALLITLILWAYAYITGFSSSVSRSVTMFTFYSLSRIRMHRGHSVNAILVSMFMLTLIHPGRFLDVGFQLSYAAILSIVTLNPFFMRIWRPGNSLIRWCWEATGLSLAAQIGTLPLVIFYFHQVPVYALISNLFAVPLLSIIITIFVVSAPLLALGIGSGITNFLLQTAGSSLNSLMEFIASFPGSVVTGLYTDRVITLMLMIILFLLILFLNSRKRAAICLSIAALCFMGLWQASESLTRLQSAEAQVAHFRGGSLLSIREGGVVDHYIFSGDPVTIARMDQYLSLSCGGRRFEMSVISPNKGSPGQEELGGASCAIGLSPGIWLVGNSRIRGLVMEGSPAAETVMLLSGLDPDFILLSGEPLLNGLSELPNGGSLVLDGSSRSWYSLKLLKAGLRFHNTATHGAFVMQY